MLPESTSKWCCLFLTRGSYMCLSSDMWPLESISILSANDLRGVCAVMQMQSNETGLSMASATPMLVVGTVSASKVRPAVIDYPTETDSDNPSNPAAAPVQGPHVTFCTAGLSGKRQGSKPHAPHAFGCAASICGSPQSSSAVTAVWSPATSTAAAASCAAPTCAISPPPMFCHWSIVQP